MFTPTANRSATFNLVITRNLSLFLPKAWMTFLVWSIFFGTAQAATVVGKVEFSRGQVNGQLDSAESTKLNKGTELHQGELITTGPNGIAIIRLADDSRMTLRANSKFRVDSHEKGGDSSNSDNKPGMFMSLLKGGLRIVTGLIGKQNPDGYRLSTPVATIGIRGTEFNARLCTTDCATEESGKSIESAKPKAEPVGRVALQTGEVLVYSQDGAERKLNQGGPVYEGDRVETASNSQVILSFKDQTRISLNQKTAFKVEALKYNHDKEEGSAFFRLIRGGLRALTGLVGKSNPDAFKVATPVATIGIRGTGFDLVCQGSCASAGGNLGTTVNTASADGMFASTWNGVIELETEAQTVLLESGNSTFIANGLTAPVTIPQIPAAIQQLMAPRPDFVSVPDLFESVSPTDINEGLYVNVDDGHVILENDSGRTLDLGAGEAGYVSDIASLPLRLSNVPGFQLLDNFPSPSGFDIDSPDLSPNLLDELAVGAAALGGAVILATSDDEPEEQAVTEKPQTSKPDYNRTGFYLGLGAGKTGSEADEDEIEMSLTDANGVSGSVDIDGIENDSAGETKRAYIGYRFSKNFALELSKYDLGKVDIDIDGSYTDVNAFSDVALDEIPFLVDGTSLTGNLLIPLGFVTERLTIMLKGGVMYWEGDVEANFNGQNFSKSVDGDSTIFGVGLALNFGDYLSLRLDVDKIDIDPEPLGIVTAGVMLQF